MKKQIQKEIQAAMAGKAEEARGLLEMIKVLSKKAMAGKLTTAELDVFQNSIHQACSVLSEARSLYWKSQDLLEGIDTAVRLDGNGHAR